MVVRPATPADVQRVAEVHVRSWQIGYRGLVPADYLAALRPEDRAKRYNFDDPEPGQPTTLVAVKDGTVIGFVTTGAYNGGDAEGAGEIKALYVDPSHWGTGAGRALIVAGRTRLVDQGFCQAVLWLLAGNQGAERFYRIDGWVHDGSRRVDEVWGLKLEQLRYKRALRDR